jgi:hypothetical protein
VQNKKTNTAEANGKIEFDKFAISKKTNRKKYKKHKKLGCKMLYQNLKDIKNNRENCRKHKA